MRRVYELWAGAEVEKTLASPCVKNSGPSTDQATKKYISLACPFTPKLPVPRLRSFHAKVGVSQLCPTFSIISAINLTTPLWPGESLTTPKANLFTYRAQQGLSFHVPPIRHPKIWEPFRRGQRSVVADTASILRLDSIVDFKTQSLF